MFDDIDRAYFARRAAQCRANAQNSNDLAVKRIHSEMAEEYERRARGEPPRELKRY